MQHSLHLKSTLSETCSGDVFFILRTWSKSKGNWTDTLSFSWAIVQDWIKKVKCSTVKESEFQ